MALQCSHDPRKPWRRDASRPVSPSIRVRTPSELRAARRKKAHPCWGHLVAAPLWPLHGANLGTLLRTCDAVGACLAVPRFPWVPEALRRGNTLRRPACVHWVHDPPGRLGRERAAGTGASLNVAVVGSLVLYKLAGLL